MNSNAQTATVDNRTRLKIITSHPIFSKLTPEEFNTLNQFLVVASFNPGEIVVAEGELVNCIYFIVQGTAEVKLKTNPIATLHEEETIGLSETGFYATTGKRTATVVAQSKLILLRLNITDLNHFLKKYPHLNEEMQKNAELILRMDFIKQVVPFAHLSMEQLYNLAMQVTEQTFAGGYTLFHQGDQGESCYLIRSGRVAITAEMRGSEKLLAELAPSTIFGETALLMAAPRNATAKTLEPTSLLVITREVLSKVMSTGANAAAALMNIIVTRSRPYRYPYIENYHTQAADKQEIITLKDPQQGKYFRLSQQGWFIWQQLNGENSLQEITLNFFKKFQTFNPELISSFIIDLDHAGFLAISKGERKRKTTALPLWLKFFLRIRQLMEFRINFTNVDSWLTKTYQRVAYLFFTVPMQLILGLIVIVGIISFARLFHHGITLFGTTPHAVWLVFVAIPFGKALCILHELGHAYATKYFGRKVKSFGIGWYWVGPMAFCDTSDMWLNPARQRLVVDLAGIYVDMIISGIAAIAAFFVLNPYLFLFLWLFVLFNYLSVFVNLSPVLELDGYYALMDLFDKPNLREASVQWLLKDLPQALRKPALIFHHPIELTYWLLCIIYLFFQILIPYFLMNYLLQGLLGKRNPFISILTALIVTIFSVLGLWGEIRRKQSLS